MLPKEDLEANVAKAAEAAATAAAHAVEAAKAAEAASKDREAYGNAAAVAAADAARQAAGAAKAANAERATEMAATSSEPTVLEPSLSEPGDETQEPQPTEVNQSPTAERDDGIEPTETTTTLDGDEAGDLLGLDSPTSSTPNVLARLGLLAALGAAGVFALSVRCPWSPRARCST